MRLFVMDGEFFFFFCFFERTIWFTGSMCSFFWAFSYSLSRGIFFFLLSPVVLSLSNWTCADVVFLFFSFFQTSIRRPR